MNLTAKLPAGLAAGLTVVLAVTAPATVSTAQIPMSDFVRTFHGAQTSGYYFQAPAAFAVTNVQVPDESNQGTYQFAIYKLTQAPPALSSTLAVTPVVYRSGIKSGDWAQLATPVTYAKGDWFAVLGCAGPTSGSCANSYGVASDRSLLCGLPITLNRCGMQANIGVNKGVGAMWSEDAGPIGRVRVVLQTGAKWLSSRTWSGIPRCIPAGGHDLTIPDRHSGALGNVFALRIQAGTANTGTVLAFGANPGSILVPGFGLLCARNQFAFVFLGPSSTAGTTFPLGTVPLNKSVVGARFMIQAALQAPGPIPLTNSVAVVIGN